MGERTPRTNPSILDESLMAGLKTPRRGIAESNPEIGRQRLPDSTQLKIIGTAYEQSPLTFDDAIEAAILVGHLVRQTLEFEDMDEATPLLTTELIAQREKANCYGYTIVASECLDQIGVEHYVGYVNQHAVVMLFDRTSGSKRSFLLDVATKEFYQETTKAVGGEDPLDQLWRGELRAINTLQTSELLRKVDIDDPGKRQKFIRDRFWLSFDKDSRHRDDDEYEYLLHSQLQLITMPSVPGREMLRLYHNVIINTLGNNPDPVAASEDIIDQFAGIYPDIDPRNKLEHAKALRTKLIDRHMGDSALALADVIKASLLPDDTSESRFFKGETLRKIAKVEGDPKKIDEAIKEYDNNNDDDDELFKLPPDNDEFLASVGRVVARKPVLSYGFRKTRMDRIAAAKQDKKKIEKRLAKSSHHRTPPTQDR